jgi:hypothetical protein
MRVYGKINSGGGKDKQTRILNAIKNYLNKTKGFLKKVEASIPNISTSASPSEILYTTDLFRFKNLLIKHLDLIERRIIHGEKIPNDEKLFSIFLPFTEIIIKGKIAKKQQFAVNLLVTTNQYGFLVDTQIMHNITDSETIKPLVERLLKKYDIRNWSFDKGFFSTENKNFLKENKITPIMPKKGKRTEAENIEEKTPQFKRLKNAHSAIESNINELQHSGLSRCPDKNLENFTKFINLAQAAYNIKRIGRIEINKELKKTSKRGKIIKTKLTCIINPPPLGLAA